MYPFFDILMNMGSLNVYTTGYFNYFFLGTRQSNIQTVISLVLIGIFELGFLSWGQYGTLLGLKAGFLV